MPEEKKVEGKKPEEDKPKASAPTPPKEPEVKTPAPEAKVKTLKERNQENKKVVDAMTEDLISYQASKEGDDLAQADKDRLSRQIKALKEASGQMK